MSKIQLPSYLPDEVYKDRTVMGVVLTGALMAMFNHRVNNSGNWSMQSLAETLTYPLLMPAQYIDQLDSIILEQGKTMGFALHASDLVMTRVLWWERHDYAKTSRWVRALDKAARIQQQITRTPISDPFRREVKKLALEELRPVVARLQKKFQAQHSPATEKQILAEFRREASNPDLRWLSDSSNLNRWLEFCKSDPLSFLESSPAQLFDGFAAFVSGHQEQYTRQKYSTNK